MRTYANHQIQECRINADTGEMIGQSRTISSQQLGAHYAKEVKAVQSAQTDLATAVKTAEQQNGGRAILAKLETRGNGNAAYDLDLVKNGQLHTAMVNPGCSECSRRAVNARVVQ